MDERQLDRPSFFDIGLHLAHQLARRSTCRRLRVGAVIALSDFSKLWTGYNGNARGLPNDCDSSEPGACGCVHAEENAVIHCDAPRELPKIVYCTDAPCVACAKRLLQLGGVTMVWYERAYRLPRGVELLATAGVIVTQLSPPSSAR